MKRINIIALGIIFLVIFFSIVYKIIHVPITHDEAPSAVTYFNYSVWEIMMYPNYWPNNHILNTLLTKLFIVLFGKEQWVIRLPNLLCFIGFAFAAYYIIRLLFKNNSVLIIGAAFLFFGNPYLLDFFGLCRGYGMGAAFATISACLLMYGYYQSSDKKIWLAFILAILASYANFTILIFWVAVTILCSIYFLYKYWNLAKQIVKHLGLFLIISIGYIALIVTPIRKMISANQFRFWTSNGFYSDTLFSMAENLRYNDGFLLGLSRDTIIALALIVLAISVAVILWRFVKIGWSWENFKRPLTIACLILCLTVAVNILQCWIMNTPNLSERAALFLFPLFSILMVSLLAEIDNFKRKRAKLFLAIIIPVYISWHMINTYNPRSVKEWRYDENTLEVIKYLKNIHAHSNSRITLKTNWLFNPSFYFYRMTGKTPWLELYLYDKNIDKNTDAQFYYIMDKDLNQLIPEFKIIKYFGENGLLVKKVKDYKNDTLAFYNFEHEGTDLDPHLTTQFAKSGLHSLRMDSTMEFSPGITEAYYEVVNADGWLRVRVFIYPVVDMQESPAWLVITMKGINGSYKYKRIALEEESLTVGEWNEIVMDYKIPYVSDEDDVITAYIWNKGRGVFYVDDIQIELLEPREE